MKKLLLVLVLAAASLGHAQSAYDFYWQQRNPANTAAPTYKLSPTASSLFGFSSTKAGVNVTLGSGLVLSGGNVLSVSGALTGVDSVTASASTNLTLAAGSGNQSVALTPSGTGSVLISGTGNATTALLQVGAADTATKASGLAFYTDTWFHRQGVGTMRIDTSGGSASLNFARAATDIGQIYFDTSQAIIGSINNVPLILRTNTTAALTLSNTQAATFASTVTTAAPTAGSAGAWKLGALITSAGLLVSTTQAVRINIGGTDYSLAVLTTNP